MADTQPPTLAVIHVHTLPQPHNSLGSSPLDLTLSPSRSTLSSIHITSHHITSHHINLSVQLLYAMSICSWCICELIFVYLFEVCLPVTTEICRVKCWISGEVGTEGGTNLDRETGTGTSVKTTTATTTTTTIDVDFFCSRESRPVLAASPPLVVSPPHCKHRIDRI